MNITTGKKARPQRVALYGPEGIGKSTLAACWPAPLFFDLEGGTAHMDVARNEPASWNQLVANIMQAQTMAEYQTIVVDTLDAAEKLCTTEVCRKNKKDSIEAFGYGKGYTYVSEEFTALLAALDQCIKAGKNVVVVAHAAMRKFEQPDEAAPYDRWELKLSKKCAPLVKEWCDALLFLNYETFVEQSGSGRAKARGGRRIMQVDHHPCWDAKNRWGLTGKVPMEWESIAAHIPAGDAAPPASPQEPHEPQEQPREEPELTDIDVLRGLLADGGYTEEMLERVVCDKGFYPEGTTIDGYSDEFIRDMCLEQWGNLVPLLNDKIVPF